MQNRAYMQLIMTGKHVIPRWRTPLWFVLVFTLCSCAGRTEKRDEDSGLPLPSVRMALVKIPLNHGRPDIVGDGSDPLDNFVPEPVAVTHVPKW